MEIRALHGACSCGRNHYTVEIPSQRNQSELDVFLDNSSTTRRHHAAPLTAFLRVPISWYHSTTIAFLPDETHTSIRRTYTDPSVPDTQRQFCGYCGTQLNRWTERRSEDADFISLTLGSLFDEDVRVLDEIGLLSRDENDNDESALQEKSRQMQLDQDRGMRNGQELILPSSSRHVLSRGTPWFEEMIEDSNLGRAIRKRGAYVSQDGTSRLDYEIVELEHSDEGTEGARQTIVSKRKWEGDAAGGLPKDNDVDMSSAFKDN